MSPSAKHIASVEEDLFSRLLVVFVRWSSQLPGWRIGTMRKLALSEQDGVALIEASMSTIQDQQVLTKLSRHLSDEKRHATSFSARFQELSVRSQGAQVAFASEALPAKPCNMFELLAYLELQEARAISVLKSYARLYAGDQETVDLINTNLKDEYFHAQWTHCLLYTSPSPRDGLLSRMPSSA